MLQISLYIYIYISNQGIVSFLWIFLFPSLASKEVMNDWWPEEGWIIDVIIWGWVIVGQCEEGFGLLFFFFFYCWCLINWIYFINTFLHLLLLFPLKFLSLCEPGSYLPNYIWLKSVGTLVEFLRSLFGLDILTFFFFFWYGFAQLSSWYVFVRKWEPCARTTTFLYLMVIKPFGEILMFWILNKEHSILCTNLV